VDVKNVLPRTKYLLSKSGVKSDGDLFFQNKSGVLATFGRFAASDIEALVEDQQKASLLDKSNFFCRSAKDRSESSSISQTSIILLSPLEELAQTFDSPVTRRFGSDFVRGLLFSLYRAWDYLLQVEVIEQVKHLEIEFFPDRDSLGSTAQKEWDQHHFEWDILLQYLRSMHNYFSKDAKILWTAQFPLGILAEIYGLPKVLSSKNSFSILRESGDMLVGLSSLPWAKVSLLATLIAVFRRLASLYYYCPNSTNKLTVESASSEKEDEKWFQTLSTILLG